jgi:uncharacterized protein YceK
MMGLRRLAAIVLISLFLAGCQTIRSFEGGCRGVYSGLRFYGDQVSELPPGGKLFFTLDLPFTAVADTLLLPVTAFLEPERPRLGWVEGCRWAGR